jgi:tetratricopeptide (TPR) repeat protein
MTELLSPPTPPSGSGADQSAHIRTLEVQLASDLNNPNNPSLHAELAWAYLEANQFDKAIKSFETCYELNINNGDNIHAAKAASVMGYCFLKRSWKATNSRPNKSQDWRDGIRWKLQASKLYEKLYQRNLADSKTIKNYALNEDSIGHTYLSKPNQAKKYCLRGMQLKKKAYDLFEELSQTDPSILENCAKTAAYISKEYLKASQRLWEGNPEQAEKYWQEGIEWKEKAYTSYEELSDTDPSKKQDCALTAAQLGKEFANQENFEKAVEWYEKALQHDPSNKFIIQELEALAEALEILEASEEVNRARY